MALSVMSRLALQKHIPLLQDGHYAKRYGWQVNMDWETGVCHVRLICPFVDKELRKEHVYMIQISFDYYPAEQPGVRFVDPETRQVGNSETFQRCWPNIEGNPWINVQMNAQDPGASYLCFQWTHEFRKTHGQPEPTDPKTWNSDKHSVVGVIRMIQKALNSPYYKGYRQP